MFYLFCDRHDGVSCKTSASNHSCAYCNICNNPCCLINLYLPLCLDASSSPPRWDILMHMVADLHQACEESWVCSIYLFLLILLNLWVSKAYNLSIYPQLLTAMRFDTKTNGYVNILAKNCKKKKGAEDKHDQITSWGQTVVSCRYHSPLSQPVSSSWFLLCDSSVQKNKLVLIVCLSQESP